MAAREYFYSQGYVSIAKEANTSIVWDWARGVSISRIKHRFGAPAKLQFNWRPHSTMIILTMILTRYILWQLEHPDHSSCFAFSLIFRGIFLGRSDLPGFRAGLLVISLRPIAFMAFGWWSRTIFTEMMSICTAVETSSEVLGFSFGECINVFFIFAFIPTLVYYTNVHGIRVRGYSLRLEARWWAGHSKKACSSFVEEVHGLHHFSNCVYWLKISIYISARSLSFSDDLISDFGIHFLLKDMLEFTIPYLVVTAYLSVATSHHSYL